MKSNRQDVSLIIRAGLIITDPFSPVITDGAIAVLNDKIIEIGPGKEICNKYNPVRTLNRPDSLVMPGLINMHTHCPMTLFRGLADDLPLKQWLEEYIFPAESKLTPERIRLGTELACSEMIRCGTTSFVDMYLFEDQIAEVVDKVGMRVWIGEGIFDFPTPAFPSGQAALEETDRLADKWANHPRITVTVTPHTPYTCDKKLLIAASEYAQKNNLLLHIHVSETQWEVQEITSKTGASPVEYLNTIGLLNDHTLAAHCVALTPEDIEILARNRVRVLHCPESNLKLASGIAPVPDMIKKEILVSLGTDGAASNNDLDMFGEMDFAAKIHKGVCQDPTVLPAPQVLAMTTLNAARSLHRDDLGILKPDAQADIICLDINKPHLIPMTNPISHIVYSACKADVQDVIVAGNILMEDRQLTTVNEDALSTSLR